jgi:hypothetical protein
MAADYQTGVSECNRRAVESGRPPVYQNSGYQKMPAFA